MEMKLPFPLFLRQWKINRLTIKMYIADVPQEIFSTNWVHRRADANVAGAQVFVHVLQCMGHGIYSIDHKLNFTFLLVLGM